MILEAIGVCLLGLLLVGSSRVPFLCMVIMTDVLIMEGRVPRWMEMLNIFAKTIEISPPFGVKMAGGREFDPG